MGEARVGVSGWSYQGWAESFYPPGLARKRQLAHLASVFDTVEVNGSFYSLLSPRTYATWYEQTPAGFRFAVKGSRFITHNKRLRDVRVPLANFFASGVLALGDKLGPFLWQLSARHRFDADVLRDFLAVLPRSTRSAARLAREHDHRVRVPLVRALVSQPLRHALEPRHESFFSEEALRLLRGAGVALAVSDSADWPIIEEVTADFAYLRLHGRPRTYRSRYGRASLERWAAKVRARRRAGDVFVYFDNDAEGHAPRDALRLRALLAPSNISNPNMTLASAS
jgi:uncharacterized protein YecE (DUF72 family)